MDLHHWARIYIYDYRILFLLPESKWYKVYKYTEHVYPKDFNKEECIEFFKRKTKNKKPLYKMSKQEIMETLIEPLFLHSETAETVFDLLANPEYDLKEYEDGQTTLDDVI